jgi:hypothetical protein
MHSISPRVRADAIESRVDRGRTHARSSRGFFWVMRGDVVALAESFERAFPLRTVGHAAPKPACPSEGCLELPVTPAPAAIADLHADRRGMPACSGFVIASERNACCNPEGERPRGWRARAASRRIARRHQRRTRGGRANTPAVPVVWKYS